MMQTESQALTAAISHFASQPGTTPAQVEQLRSALLAEQTLLASYNAAAASGALSGFAVGTAPTQHIPTGQFDKGSGIVTLPSSSFLPSGAAPTPDLGSVLHVQAMVVEFSSKSYSDASGVTAPVSADMVSNLQDTLNGSPALAMEVKRAAVTPNPADPTHRILESFDFTAPKAGVGGSYSPPTQTMNLPAVSLSNAGYNAHDLTFVIGHEVQHGFDALDAANGRNSFIRDAQAIAATRSPIHDYTRPIENYIQSGRDDEARAEIAGWNALQSRVHQRQPAATLQDIDRAAPMRARDFLSDQGGLAVTPRANVQLNSDQTMSPTPANVAAMGQNYFDRPTAAHKAPSDTRQPMALGGVSDYPNYYARWAIATASWAEQNAPSVGGQKPQIAINMAHAGLYEEMIERSGLDLGSGKRVPYLDSSQVPATAHHFDHTLNGPNQNKYVPISQSAPVGEMESGLHKGLRAALPAETSQDRIAQIALAAKEGGIEAGRIRTMDVVGRNLVLTGTTPGTHASVDLAAPPPAAGVSNGRFQAVAEQQSQTQQMPMTQQHAGPTMSHHH